MSGDSSLTDFATEDALDKREDDDAVPTDGARSLSETEPGGSDPAADAAKTERSTEESDGADRPASPTPTLAVDIGDRVCDRCGQESTRRWYDDGALVCGVCKPW